MEGARAGEGEGGSGDEQADGAQVNEREIKRGREGGREGGRTAKYRGKER